MSVTSDIIESWRRPRNVVRRHLARGKSEAFAFSLLFVFLLIAFIAQYPAAMQVARLDPEIPLPPQLLGRALGLLAMIPAFYLLAAASRLIGMAAGGRGSWYGARIALFWALVAVSPLVLLIGLVTAMIGPGPQLTVTGIVAFAGFLFQWVMGLMVVEQGE
ncbi:YIP1 family protein [Gemmobacter serpentinus]|uniref:YIP1 family protein n=1 Tax=Gemmobacter serpentinus TaxID=2652247 RepID=UPI00124EC436|nr:YIP1 family protein [Gemmobacter serpentinus]